MFQNTFTLGSITLNVIYFGIYTDEIRGSESILETKVNQSLKKFPANYCVRRLTAVLTGARYCFDHEKLRYISYYVSPSHALRY